MAEATPSGGAPEQRPQTLTPDQGAALLAERRAKPPQEPQEKPGKEPAHPPADAPDPAPAGQAGDDGRGKDEIEPQDAPDQTTGDTADEAAAVDLPAIAKALGLSTDDLVLEDDGTVSLKTQVDGVQAKAKLAELRRTHQLDSSLTHKHMRLAEERKQFDQQKDAETKVIGERRQELELALNMAARMLHGQFAGIDMEQLRVEDFQQYQKVKDEYDRHLQALQGLYGTLQKGDQEKLETQRKQFQDWTKTQAQELVNHVPEWKDAARARKDMETIFATAKADYGITDADLNQLYDSRYIRILKDAAAWRKLQTGKSETLKKLNEAPPLARPGTSATTKPAPTQQLRQSLSKSHSEKDAVALLDARRNQRRK